MKALRQVSLMTAGRDKLPVLWSPCELSIFSPPHFPFSFWLWCIFLVHTVESSESFFEPLLCKESKKHIMTKQILYKTVCSAFRPHSVYSSMKICMFFTEDSERERYWQGMIELSHSSSAKSTFTRLNLRLCADCVPCREVEYFGFSSNSADLQALLGLPATAIHCSAPARGAAQCSDAILTSNLASPGSGLRVSSYIHLVFGFVGDDTKERELYSSIELTDSAYFLI